MPGVNVLLVGTYLGAAADVEGYYSILNVSPGTYEVQASAIGYARSAVQNVDVSIGLTTNIDFQLQPEAVVGEEVVVTAQAPIVQPDISANVANVDVAEIVNLPVAGVSEFINLQAGIEPGMEIRGSGSGEMAFIVDGISMRSGRGIGSFTDISYTAIKKFQIQTGGFNAEYGNVRSGIVNIVTKDVPTDRYFADVLLRHSPPAQKNFGGLPSDPGAFWLKPHLADSVSRVGTHDPDSPWDVYEQRQYTEFRGWNVVYNEQPENNDEDPDNDIPIEDLIEIYKYRMRKDVSVREPDYTVDASLGGPIPLGGLLGNLRFLASYRETQGAYMVPQSRSVNQTQTYQIKLISDLSKTMKLQVGYLHSLTKAMSTSLAGGALTAAMPAYPWHETGMSDLYNGGQEDFVFANDRWNPIDLNREMFNVVFTHMLSPQTFYDVTIQQSVTDYWTRTGRERDTTKIHTIGNVELDETPFGFTFDPTNDYSGVRTSAHWGNMIDSSRITVLMGRFDLTSQLSRNNTFKTGLEFISNRYEMDYARYDVWFDAPNYFYDWQQNPIQGAVYAQNKLEFKGMIANLGLRLDYFSGNGEWWDHDPYDRAFSGVQGFDNIDENVKGTKPMDNLVYLSPRMGVSFPVTVTSKLFFNYGHFRQMINPEVLFSNRRDNMGALIRLGNPNHPMPRTIEYELGYENSILDRYLLRLSGFYKDVTEQQRGVTFTNIDESVRFQMRQPYNFEDIRGFEVSLTSHRGQYFRGFVNYTYLLKSAGDFGYDNYYENQASMKTFLREYDASQDAWLPEPFARFNLEFLAPPKFGPGLFGLYPIGDWRVSLLGEYRAGQWFKWTEEADLPLLDENVQYQDYYMLDMRLSKNIKTSLGEVQLFVDVDNLLNLKQMHKTAGFFGSEDEYNYMRSLHLPEDVFGDYNSPYPFVPGDDRPGDVRKEGVDFVPIEAVGTETGLPVELDLMLGRRVLYYVDETGEYWEMGDGAWSKADQGFVDQVLEDKAYIDMPNLTYDTFLGPRSIMFGIRVSF